MTSKTFKTLKTSNLNNVAIRTRAVRILPPALAAILGAGLALGTASSTAAAAGAAGAAMRDSQVVPAGGGRCHACQPGTCRHGGHGGHGHLAGCREGHCVAYCPVRPQQFGFYGTQWRQWPGQAVVPVSDERRATPAVPPRLAIPSPEQEAMRPQEDELERADPRAKPDEPAAPADLPSPAAPQPPLEPAPRPTVPREPEPRPLEPAREAEPAVPADAEEPALPKLQKPGDTRPEDENLFEARPRETIRRRFLVGPAATEADGEGAVRPAAHGAAAHPRPDPRQVPRVPFDPAAESRRLRSGR
jgi:hypothetical protein